MERESSSRFINRSAISFFNELIILVKFFICRERLTVIESHFSNSSMDKMNSRLKSKSLPTKWLMSTNDWCCRPWSFFVTLIPDSAAGAFLNTEREIATSTPGSDEIGRGADRKKWALDKKDKTERFKLTNCWLFCLKCAFCNLQS